MNTSFRKISILGSALVLASLFVWQAHAVPAHPPKNPKMDKNQDHQIDNVEKKQAQKKWNQNHPGCQAGECGPNKGPNAKGPNGPGNPGQCKPGDQKCIQHWKQTHPKDGQQGQKPNCHPKDKKCMERYKKFQKSKVNKPWEENADVNNDGHVGKVENKKYKKDMKDGTLDGASGDSEAVVEEATEVTTDGTVAQ